LKTVKIAIKKEDFFFYFHMFMSYFHTISYNCKFLILSILFYYTVNYIFFNFIFLYILSSQLALSLWGTFPTVSLSILLSSSASIVVVIVVCHSQEWMRHQLCAVTIRSISKNFENSASSQILSQLRVITTHSFSALIFLTSQVVWIPYTFFIFFIINFIFSFTLKLRRVFVIQY